MKLLIDTSLPPSREITVGKRVALVDESDYETLSNLAWHMTVSYKRKDKMVHARHTFQNGDKKVNVYMHHLILMPPAGYYIDHINRDGLDNRRNNLRIVSPRESVLNRNAGWGLGLSGYRGVYYFKGKWQARISIWRKKICLGTYINKEDAAIAYDMAALTFNGDFAQTNILKEKLAESLK